MSCADVVEDFADMDALCESRREVANELYKERVVGISGVLSISIAVLLLPVVVILLCYIVVCKLSWRAGKAARKDEEVEDDKLCFILSARRRGSEAGSAGSGVTLLLYDVFALCVMFAV